MIINTGPNRLIGAADEVGLAERNITVMIYEIEAVITNLRHHEDESMQIVASKLTKTLEELRRKNRAVKLTQVALEKIAEEYLKTEESIRAYEDRLQRAPAQEMTPQDTTRYKPYVDQTFSEL